MKAAQMADCLQKIAPLLEGAEASRLRALAKILEAEGAGNFGAYAKRAVKALGSIGTVPTKTAGATMVSRIGEIAQAAGAGPAAKEFAIAAQLLDASSSIETSELAAALSLALAPPPRKQRPPKPVPIDPRAAADQLTGYGPDATRFDALVNELSKLPKAKLVEVAVRYLGYDRKFKSKDDVKKAIHAHRLQDVVDDTREDRGAKITL